MISSREVAGYMVDPDYDVFEWLASEVKTLELHTHQPVRILEVGTLFGKSSLAISEAFDRAGINHSINTYDLCIGNKIEFGDVKKCSAEEQKQITTENLSDHPNITFIADIWTPEVEEDFDIFFYDGDHTYGETMKALNYKNPWIVLMDDYYEDPHESMKGLKQAVDEYIAQTGKELKKFDGSKIVAII